MPSGVLLGLGDTHRLNCLYISDPHCAALRNSRDSSYRPNLRLLPRTHSHLRRRHLLQFPPQSLGGTQSIEHLGTGLPETGHHEHGFFPDRSSTHFSFFPAFGGKVQALRSFLPSRSLSPLKLLRSSSSHVVVIAQERDGGEPHAAAPAAAHTVARARAYYTTRALA